jgi:hypothetical protein
LRNFFPVILLSYFSFILTSSAGNTTKDLLMNLKSIKHKEAHVMKLLSKKMLAVIAAGVFILAAAGGPFIAQAANVSNDRPGIHHHQPSPNEMAEHISQTFGVSKDSVLKYFEQGVSFRNLGRGAFLARTSDKSLDEVMVLKTETNTWKDVTTSLGITKEQMKATRQDMVATNLNTKLGFDKQATLELLNQGYHSRDIAVANELSQNSGKTVSDVLTLKKINNTWRDVAHSLNVDDATLKQDLKALREAFPHKGGFRHSKPELQ